MNAGVRFSIWAPLWATLGVSLPLSFAAVANFRLYFLTTWELVPLYATEWLVFGIAGLAMVGVLGAAGAVQRRHWPVTDSGRLARVLFAMILGVSLVFGARAWLLSLFPVFFPAVVWTVAVLAVGLGFGLLALLRPRSTLFSRSLAIARPVAIFGALTLASLPWVVGSSHTAPQPRLSVAQASQPPNIVLISIDTLAASHLVPYGYGRATSPRIAAFAAAATVYDDMHASANFTTPSVASMLTGVSPWSHRTLQLYGGLTDTFRASALPARLRAAGYRSAAFGSNPWAGARQQRVLEYFDHWESGTDWAFGPCFDRAMRFLPYICPAFADPMIGAAQAKALRVAAAAGLVDLSRHSDPAQVAARVDAWLSRPSDGPVFVWAHFLQPHDPYAAPSPWIGRFDASAGARDYWTSQNPFNFNAATETPARMALLEARYDESVSYVDDAVGHLIESVRAHLGPNTAILITADHGESFAHGYGGHAGLMLYEDLIHVPLIVSWPQGAGMGERRAGLVSHVDIAPTVAALAGIVPSPGWQGISLRGGAVDAERTVYAMNFEQNTSRGRLRTGSVAALRGRWKLVRYFGRPRYAGMPALHTTLYDLVADPQEVRDVAALHADIVAMLSAGIDAELERHGHALPE